jgi:hypothetical protein
MFVDNLQRRAIWNGFQEFLEHIRLHPDLSLIYVDGSFVTDKTHPKDVDIIIEYPDGATQIRLNATYWFLRLRDRVWHRYMVDVLDTIANEPSPNMTEFFQLLRPEEAIQRGLPAGSQKGILRIALR